MNKSKALFFLFVLSFFSFGFVSCKASYHRVPVVKNKKRLFPYDAGKDRKKKRTKIVKFNVRK